jgi:hypothetical protein
VPDQSHLFEEFTRSSRWFLLPSEGSEVFKALRNISHLGPARQFLGLTATRGWGGGGGVGGGGRVANSSIPSTSTQPPNGHANHTTFTHLGNGGSDVRATGNGYATGNGHAPQAQAHSQRGERGKVNGYAGQQRTIRVQSQQN